MQIKYRNNGNFEHLYPKTLSGNVEMNSGKTLEEWKGEVDDDLNEIEKDIKDITPSSDLLWEGRNVLDGGKSVKPSKKLNECATGWTLIWTKTGGKQQFQYTNIPKLSLRVGLRSEEWKGEVDDDLNEIEKDIKDITPSSDLLWEGRNVLDGGKSVKPSKKLNECATGWTLIWTKTGGKQQFQYTNIPKLSLRVGLS